MSPDTAVAALLGTGAGVGLVVTVLGLRPRESDPAPRSAALRWRRSPERLALAGGCAMVVGALTRWPVGAVLAAMACWWLPELLGRDREHARRVERIEAVATWTESLRDTLAGAAGLEQTVIATASVAPAPIAEEVTELAARLEAGASLSEGLRALSDDLADPTADLVVASLRLTAETEASDVGSLLGRLAAAAREQAGMRMRVAAGRARVRSSVRIITAATVALIAGLLVWSRSYLAPYDSGLGQLVLVVVGGCFAGAFAWLQRIGRIDEPPRVLATARADGASPSTDGVR